VRKPATLVLLLAVVLATACEDASNEEPTPNPRSSPPATPSSDPGSAAPTGDGARDRPFDPDGVDVRLRPVVGGLDAPLLVTAAEDGSGRLFVLEQVGRIRVVADGRLLAEPFLDLGDRVVSGGEQGLLGFAFHPLFERNGRFFVDYTDTSGDTVVAEYRVSDEDADRADPGSERVLLQIDQPFANHNGGHLAFGPDGYLYVATGDGGSAGDPMGNGQRLDTLLGKVLRIDVDARGGRAYGIPPDNPFVDREGARPEIWAFGLRNPWRFSFDRETGDLWIGDVGQGSFEEIDHVAGDEAGVNFGWNVMEGPDCFEPASGCDESGLTMPVAVYGHGEGCSVTGGFVYRGSRRPELRRAYLYADYCSGRLWGLDAERADARPAVLLETGRSISSFGQDEAGELYVTDHAGGEVLLVVASAA
jgi:glucose/arabinose dehydrogenase